MRPGGPGGGTARALQAAPKGRAAQPGRTHLTDRAMCRQRRRVAEPQAGGTTEPRPDRATCWRRCRRVADRTPAPGRPEPVPTGPRGRSHRTSGTSAQTGASERVQVAGSTPVRAPGPRGPADQTHPTARRRAGRRRGAGRCRCRCRRDPAATPKRPVVVTGALSRCAPLQRVSGPPGAPPDAWRGHLRDRRRIRRSPGWPFGPASPGVGGRSGRCAAGLAPGRWRRSSRRSRPAGIRAHHSGTPKSAAIPLIPSS